MSKVVVLVSSSVVLAVAVTLAGCAQEANEKPAPPPAAPQDQPADTGREDADHDHADHDHADHDHADHDHADHDHADHDHAGEGHDADSGDAGHGEHGAALAELSPEDRALAEKQKICPVSGQALGSMGKPYKVTVEGREVLLCCSGCESKIKEDPEKYLAKLPE